MSNRLTLVLPLLALACLFPTTPLFAQATKEQIVDLAAVPQLHETPAQRDARMQWFRDAKFGMFIHWGPCTLGDREIGWGRKAGRPWDINGVQSRTEDPEYDNYYKKFNPVNYDADAWVTMAKDAGMKYMVLITKHHDGFCQFDTKLTDYSIMSSPYKKDIIKQFVDACHKHGMKVGLYYSTRDWHHPDYLVGDNARYDQYYRSQIEELLTNYGKVDIMWFDHVGGRDWSKWRFDQLFAMMYRLQPNLLVNNRAAKFCGPKTPTDQGPASPDIAAMCSGDYYTPEGHIGALDLKRDWESCIITTNVGWSYNSKAKPRSSADCLDMLVSTATGGGNLLLNFAPDPTGAFRPVEIALAKDMGNWLKKYGQAIYSTRGGPFANAPWGGSTHRDKTIYVISKDWPSDKLTLGPIPQKITAAELLLSGKPVSFDQSEKGITLTLPPDLRDTPYSVVKLTTDQPVPDGLAVAASARKAFDDSTTFGHIISDSATFTLSSQAPQWNRPADNALLFKGPLPTSGFAFHTANESAPFVQVDLGKESNLTALHIENRPRNHQPATLKVFLSSDSTTWTEVFADSFNKDAWDIPLTQTLSGAPTPGRPARYLKIQATYNEKPAGFTLRRLEIYAK